MGRRGVNRWSPDAARRPDGPGTDCPSGQGRKKAEATAESFSIRSAQGQVRLLADAFL